MKQIADKKFEYCTDCPCCYHDVTYYCQLMNYQFGWSLSFNKITSPKTCKLPDV